MDSWRRYLSGLAVLALTAGAFPASAAQVPEKEGVSVAEFTIVGHKFRIPKAYLTQAQDKPGRMIDYWGGRLLWKGLCQTSDQ